MHIGSRCSLPFRRLWFCVKVNKSADMSLATNFLDVTDGGNVIEGVSPLGPQPGVCAYYRTLVTQAEVLSSTPACNLPSLATPVGSCCPTFDGMGPPPTHACREGHAGKCSSTSARAL